MVGRLNRGRRLLAAAAGVAVVMLVGVVAVASQPSDQAEAGVFETAEMQRARHQDFVAEDAPESSLAIEPEAVKQGEGSASTEARYTLAQFISSGVVNWGGYRFTYYSQRVLPGTGLAIPGRHVNAGGFVSDGEGYIVLAGSAPKGTVYETPFGYQGKVYDRGTVGKHLDVYVR